MTLLLEIGRTAFVDRLGLVSAIALKHVEVVGHSLDLKIGEGA